MRDPQHFTEAEQQASEPRTRAGSDWIINVPCGTPSPSLAQEGPCSHDKMCNRCLYILDCEQIGAEQGKELTESRKKNGDLALKNLALSKKIRKALKAEADWRLQHAPNIRCVEIREILEAEED